jgi:hypothetical protein
MASTTQIQVTAVDNEVYIIASTSAGSSELCHVKSGYNKPVSCTFDAGAILAPGTYDLTVIGINWGGPGVYAVSAPGTTPALVNPPPSTVVGVFHSQTVKMTITGP